MQSRAGVRGVDPFAQNDTFWRVSGRLLRYRVSLGGPMRESARRFWRTLRHDVRGKRNKLTRGKDEIGYNGGWD